jgi:hypothetical protein
MGRNRKNRKRLAERAKQRPSEPVQSDLQSASSNADPLARIFKVAKPSVKTIATALVSAFLGGWVTYCTPIFATRLEIDESIAPHMSWFESSYNYERVRKGLRIRFCVDNTGFLPGAVRYAVAKPAGTWIMPTITTLNVSHSPGERLVQIELLLEEETNNYTGNYRFNLDLADRSNAWVGTLPIEAISSLDERKSIDEIRGKSDVAQATAQFEASPMNICDGTPLEG